MNNKTPAPLTPSSLSQFLFYSLSLSAWKSHGDSAWSLRVNPSSGNLHPTEGYVLLPSISGCSTLPLPLLPFLSCSPSLPLLCSPFFFSYLGFSNAPGIWHYTPKDHGLEKRVEISNKNKSKKRKQRRKKKKAF